MKGTGMSSWHIWEITPRSLPPSPAPKDVGAASYGNPTRGRKPSVPKLEPMATQPEGENHPPLEVTAHKYRRFCLRRHSEEPELSYCKKSSCLKLVITKVLSLHWWLFCSLCVPKAPDPTVFMHHHGWIHPSLQTSQPRDKQAKKVKDRGRVKKQEPPCGKKGRWFEKQSVREPLSQPKVKTWCIKWSWSSMVLWLMGASQPQ